MKSFSRFWNAWTTSGSNWVLEPLRMIDRAADHYELDISRARRLLGWEPKRSLRDALPKMVAALKQDPAGWYAAHKLGSPPD